MIDLQLVIGDKKFSFWSMRPWILLKENNIPFTEISLTLNTPEFHEKIGFYSDAGKVPVLVVGDVKIWDTYSIVEYLAETFPEKNLWPKNKVLRAVARSIVAEMHSGFTDLRRNLSMNLVEKLHGKTFSEEVWKDIRRIESIWKKCLSSYQGPFLFGKEFTIADAFYAPVVGRFITYGIKTGPETSEYISKISDLSSYKEWVNEALKES
ncbi:glutathione S-transferase family protein [Leptospira borgpetersenii]|uniref:Glutathione S-transferase, N-terminal domain protein n=2 Tax=Leptospira TaxID=171 RepID=A0A0E3AYQ4_LEPBO|nr:glutathione S-transferase family protein [Leptospira borgpetersenii]EMO11621.1 glutathione S-transferase, N-terminal domain protein [Leptospira borgpetersenii str. Noumea 25]ALO26404.1 glutathione S-transferase, N-terminal domain protein [Leptospira borgpetersenii serovar Ballum]ANH01043.1 Glutathione S-transferase, N-terminal domain protein [Leptospira borgpetersenii str. 4E]EKR00187.1 glutathione S-transferase, N-terminal domain protein [Leptospira borgpetersenii serovar Castellonis str. 2